MLDLALESFKDTSKFYGILFWAPWAEPSILAEQLLDDQAADYPNITFGKVNADENEELVQLFSVGSVPTIIFLKEGKIIESFAGSDPLSILQSLQRAASIAEKGTKPLDERLHALINGHPFMIFIKGSPSAPRCGFTSTLLNHLAELGIDYGHFDILQDNEVREGLKVYSQWKTYPQIYVKGELLGGLDIFVDMMKTGDLQSVLDTLKE